MKLINDTNTTTRALTIRKETSLTIIHNVTTAVVRISSKAILATFVLTLLNLVV